MAIDNLVKKLGLGLILMSCGGGGDETAAGCKNDSECKGNGVCIDGECVEEGGEGRKDVVQTDSIPEDCDPYAYQNQCQNGVLTYCDFVSRKPTQFDCYKEGFPHCDYVDVIGNSICFGKAVYGESCPSEEEYDHSDPALIKSECDYTQMDTCIVIEPGKSWCSISCQNSSDCEPLGSHTFCGDDNYCYSV